MSHTGCVTSSLLFLTACVATRLLIVYGVAARPPTLDPKHVALPLMVPAIGFALIYALGLRDTPGETFGCRGGAAWWNGLRPVHAGMYALAAALVLRRSERAHVPLLVDVLVGISAFFLFRKTPRQQALGT